MTATCTLTGVDETTDAASLARIGRGAEWLEWGVLLSHKQAGQGGRYPSFAWIERFASDSAALGLNTALHVCGRAVRELLAGDSGLTALCARFGRIQLNFNQTTAPVDPSALAQFIGGWHTPVITQHNDANQSVWRGIDAANHHVLFDASGGRGIAAGSWPDPLPGKVCGYAGGLGPDNVGSTLAALLETRAPEPFWIDMEGKLRDPQDRFIANAAAAVVTEVRFRLEQHAPRPNKSLPNAP